LRTASVDVTWCLGVLCTVEDKATLLSELHRVLVPGGSLGLLVVVAQGNQSLRLPDGNHFPGQAELDELLAAAGFDVVEQIDRPADAPRSWTSRSAAVAAMVEARYRSHHAYALAARQGRRLADLFDGGHLSMQLIHGRKA
jgi:SAM-dependent methyltransferase